MTSILSLTHQREFDLINKTGTKLYNSYFLAILAKNFVHVANKSRVSKDLESKSTIMSLGIKASKKLGNAIIRNKIKRRIRHLVRIINLHPALYHSQNGLIFIPKKNFDKVIFATLEKAFRKTILASFPIS
jgi:ribonuclease P protein component